MAAPEEAFHVAVTQEPAGGGPPLQPGQDLRLTPHGTVYAPGAGEELSRLFVNGLSEHGQRYMTNPQTDFTARSIEILFEAIRRGDFADRPSRMESMFGFESIIDAEAFIGGYRVNQPCALYRVRGEVVHKGNMSLLQLPATGVVAFQLARSYWLGEQGPMPPLWELLLRPPVEIVELVVPVVN